MHATQLAIRSSPQQKLTTTLLEHYKLRKINESSNDIAGKILQTRTLNYFVLAFSEEKLSECLQASDFTDVLWFHDSEKFLFHLCENFKNRLHESLMSAASEGMQI